jgi:hypothetical protein
VRAAWHFNPKTGEIEGTGAVEQRRHFGYVICLSRRIGCGCQHKGGFAMAASKSRPDHVPEENVYNGVHWMVLVTYIAAIGGVAMLLVNAG